MKISNIATFISVYVLCFFVWLIEEEVVLIAGQNIRKLVKDGFIIRKPTKIHSRSRARRMKEAKRKGRHSGYGIFLRVLLFFVNGEEWSPAPYSGRVLVLCPGH